MRHCEGNGYWPRTFLGHADDEIEDIYSKLKEDVEEAEIRPGGSVRFRLRASV